MVVHGGLVHLEDIWVLSTEVLLEAVPAVGSGRPPSGNLEVERGAYGHAGHHTEEAQSQAARMELLHPRLADGWLPCDPGLPKKNAAEMKVHYVDRGGHSLELLELSVGGLPLEARIRRHGLFKVVHILAHVLVMVVALALVLFSFPVCDVLPHHLQVCLVVGEVVWVHALRHLWVVLGVGSHQSRWE